MILKKFHCGFLMITILMFFLTACSGGSDRNSCGKVQEISANIVSTLGQIQNSPSNQFNIQLADQIQILRGVKGSSAVNNSVGKLISSIEDLMTSLNSDDLASAGNAVNAMTTSIQLLTSACNS